MVRIPSEVICEAVCVGGSVSMLFGAISVSLWLCWPACRSVNLWSQLGRALELMCV